MLDDDEFTVRDLGSRNGTFVNGEKTDIKELSAGDVLSVGPLVFVVQLDGEPGEFDAKEAHRLGSSAGAAPSADAAKSERADEPTRVGVSRGAADVGAGAGGAAGSAGGGASGGDKPLGGGLLDDVGLSGGDAEDSSVIDFDFDFDDDEDEQPPL